MFPMNESNRMTAINPDNAIECVMTDKHDFAHESRNEDNNIREGDKGLTDGERVAGGGLFADGDAVLSDWRIGLREKAASGATVAEAVAHDRGAGCLLVGLDPAEALRFRAGERWW